MRQLLLFFLIVGCSCNDLLSQDYFQQEVNYRIEVALNDIDHTLSGYESISYINHAPQSLTYLYFHLWPAPRNMGLLILLISELMESQ
jgi:hypothetical protein